MIKTSWFTNPFHVYIISFSVVFVVYGLGWSEAFPNISLSVKIFFGITFFASFLLAYPINRRNKKIDFNIPVSSLNKIILIGITIGYMIEFVYNKGIPVFLILKGTDYQYTSFGIPTFHVFLHTFTSFYAVYLFHQYLSTKNRRILLYTFYAFIPHILIVNRGSLLMVWVSILFVFLLSIKRLKIKYLLSILLLVLIILYLFGYLGNIRSAYGDNTYIPRVSHASDHFLQSKVPNEYFWGYAYIASPMANFQYNINTQKPDPTFSDFFCFVKNELIFDFISKRLPGTCDVDKNKVLEHFNVATEFTNPYCSLGWMGPIILFLFGSFITFFYLIFLPYNSKYYISALAILLTVFVFNTFSNMWTFSGLSFQLLYPILGTIFKIKKKQ
jgi:hypothetical protein